LFDLAEDPNEMRDLSDDPHHADVREQMADLLAAELYGVDVDRGWVRGGKLAGEPDKDFQPHPNRGLRGQRGWR